MTRVVERERENITFPTHIPAGRVDVLLPFAESRPQSQLRHHEKGGRHTARGRHVGLDDGRHDAGNVLGLANLETLAEGAADGARS